jgi:hypothetical protein
MIEHKNNTPWWNAKQGEATAEQVAAFAKAYRTGGAGPWAVAVTEGAEWVGADHVRHTVDATRAAGAVCVWVSDGTFAQCVWRATIKKAFRMTVAERMRKCGVPEGGITVVVEHEAAP